MKTRLMTISTAIILSHFLCRDIRQVILSLPTPVLLPGKSHGWKSLVEIVINLVFIVANQRAGLNYDIWVLKHQGRVSLASAWCRPLSSMTGGRVKRCGPIRAHHTHRRSNAAGKKHITKMIIIFTLFDQYFQYCFWLPLIFNILK